MHNVVWLKVVQQCAACATKAHSQPADGIPGASSTAHKASTVPGTGTSCVVAAAREQDV